MLLNPLNYLHEEDDDQMDQFDIQVGILCVKREQANQKNGIHETDDEIFEAVAATPEFRALLNANNPDVQPISEEQHQARHQKALVAASESCLTWISHCPTTTALLLDKGIVCPFTDQFRRLASLVPSDSLVLEIGCSYGKATEILANTCTSPTQVVGIDISKETINSAQQEYPHIKFIKADCLRDPFSTLQIHQDLCKLHPKIRDLNVFVDIGGNRELESLVALLPWLEEQFHPTTIVVKSETLHAAVTELCDGLFDWKKLQAIAIEALQKRKSSSTTPTESKEETPVKIKTLHPLKAPLRKNKEGIPICRFHNYDPRGCRKFLDACGSGETCPFDHERCHICLQEDHIALNCQVGKPLI